MNHKDSAQKLSNKLFDCTEIYVCENFVFLFYFFGFWLAVEYKDFLIINMSVVCTTMLHFYVVLFLEKS